MPGDCSICLSSLKEPVCIPCGHIYCTQCLVDFVNAPGNESMEASCPMCRAQFNLLIPDLTYLPKKYHEYVMPSIRRVYLDSSRRSDLEELKASKEKIKKLEKTNEILMRQCERYMEAAHAQAEGERAARQRASDLQSQLRKMEEEHHIADANAGQAISLLKRNIGVTRAQYRNLERIYGDLWRRYEKLKTRQNQDNASTSTICVAKERHRGHHSLSGDSRQCDLSGLAKVSSTSHVKPAREVRPLPARVFLKPKARPASPPPIYVNKRQRVAPVPYIEYHNLENP